MNKSIIMGDIFDQAKRFSFFDDLEDEEIKPLIRNYDCENQKKILKSLLSILGIENKHINERWESEDPESNTHKRFGDQKIIFLKNLLTRCVDEAMDTPTNSILWWNKFMDILQNNYSDNCKERLIGCGFLVFTVLDDDEYSYDDFKNYKPLVISHKRFWLQSWLREKNIMDKRLWKLLLCFDPYWDEERHGLNPTYHDMIRFAKKNILRQTLDLRWGCDDLKFVD